MEHIESTSTLEFDVKDVSSRSFESQLFWDSIRFNFQLAAKFTTDVVVAVSFGIDGQSFTDPNADFRRFGDDIFKPSFITGLKQQISLFMPFMAKILRVGWVYKIDETSVKFLKFVFSDNFSRFVSKEIDKQFRSIVYQIIHDREVVQKIKKDDLLQVILDLRVKLGKDVMTDGIIAGHSMTFLVSEIFWNCGIKLRIEYFIF